MYLWSERIGETAAGHQVNIGEKTMGDDSTDEIPWGDDSTGGSFWVDDSMGGDAGVRILQVIQIYTFKAMLVGLFIDPYIFINFINVLFTNSGRCEFQSIQVNRQDWLG